MQYYGPSCGGFDCKGPFAPLEKNACSKKPGGKAGCCKWDQNQHGCMVQVGGTPVYPCYESDCTSMQYYGPSCGGFDCKGPFAPLEKNACSKKPGGKAGCCKWDL